MYNHNIEDWWRHCGCYDREEASPFYWEKAKVSAQEFLDMTDKWWNNLSDKDKQFVYEEFFSEN